MEKHKLTLTSYRNFHSGEFVSKKFAKNNPNTIIKETISTTFNNPLEDPMHMIQFLKVLNFVKES